MSADAGVSAVLADTAPNMPDSGDPRSESYRLTALDGGWGVVGTRFPERSLDLSGIQERLPVAMP